VKIDQAKKAAEMQVRSVGVDVGMRTKLLIILDCPVTPFVRICAKTLDVGHGLNCPELAGRTRFEPAACTLRAVDVFKAKLWTCVFSRLEAVTGCMPNTSEPFVRCKRVICKRVNIRG
jgi:hypothetical protein